MNAVILCNCGHPPSPHGEHTTGYGIDADGKTQCWSCCAEQDKACMREHGKITLYLASKSPSPSEWHITNWPGSLDLPAFNMTKSHGWGFGRRYDIVTGRFRFEGELWSFRNAGDNQIARCRRLKDPR